MLKSFIRKNWFKLAVIILSMSLTLGYTQLSSMIYAQEDEVIRFAVIGDYGEARNPFLAEVAAMVRSWDPDFIVTTGDNNYPDGEAETIDANIGQFFHDYIHPYYGEYGEGAEVNLFFPVIGNHDYTLEGSLDPYLDYFTLPNNERYYDFVWEDSIHFFMINSDDREPDGNEEDSVQGQWFKERLEESDALWKIVVLHESPYSSGYHGNEDDVQWSFTEWGADIVLSGHEHHYERIILDGLPYFVNGSGGVELRVIEIEDIVSSSHVRYNAAHGAMLVTADAEELRFEFHSIRGKPLAAVTSAPIGKWLEFDLTAHITEIDIYTLALVASSDEEIIFTSSENRINPPQLEIETDMGIFTFVVTDDTFIRASNPDKNYGNREDLELRQRDWADTSIYLRFDVTDFDGTIEKVTLRLYPHNGETKGGIAVYDISDLLNDNETIWTEENLTAETAPLIQGTDEPLDVFTLRKN